MENVSLKKELTSILKDRISLSESTRANFARGEDTYDPVLSQAVVFPETNEEVSRILKLCNEHKVPVVPFGTGTSLEGHVVGNKDGITLSLEKMNKVLSVNAADFDCRVQANVTREQLNEYLREDGVFFPNNYRSSIEIITNSRKYNECSLPFSIIRRCSKNSPGDNSVWCSYCKN